MAPTGSGVDVIVVFSEFEEEGSKESELEAPNEAVSVGITKELVVGP